MAGNGSEEGDERACALRCEGEKSDGCCLRVSGGRDGGRRGTGHGRGSFEKGSL